MSLREELLKISSDGRDEIARIEKERAEEEARIADELRVRSRELGKQYGKGVFEQIVGMMKAVARTGEERLRIEGWPIKPTLDFSKYDIMAFYYGFISEVGDTLKTEGVSWGTHGGFSESGSKPFFELRWVVEDWEKAKNE